MFKCRHIRKDNELVREGHENSQIANLLVSSSRSLASNSLLGGYFGKLDGSQGRGFVVKN